MSVPHPAERRYRFLPRTTARNTPFTNPFKLCSFLLTASFTAADIRKLALELLLEIMEGGAFCDKALHAAFEQNPAPVPYKRFGKQTS